MRPKLYVFFFSLENWSRVPYTPAGWAEPKMEEGNSPHLLPSNLYKLWQSSLWSKFHCCKWPHQPASDGVQCSERLGMNWHAFMDSTNIYWELLCVRSCKRFSGYNIIKVFSKVEILSITNIRVILLILLNVLNWYWYTLNVCNC